MSAWQTYTRLPINLLMLSSPLSLAQHFQSSSLGGIYKCLIPCSCKILYKYKYAVIENVNNLYEHIQTMLSKLLPLNIKSFEKFFI